MGRIAGRACGRAAAAARDVLARSAEPGLASSGPRAGVDGRHPDEVVRPVIYPAARAAAGVRHRDPGHHGRGARRPARARRGHTVDARRHGEPLMPMIAVVLAGRGRPRRRDGGRGRHRPRSLHRPAGRPGHRPLLAGVLACPAYGVCTLDAIAHAASPRPRAASSSSPPTPGAMRSTGLATPQPASASPGPRSGLPPGWTPPCPRPAKARGFTRSPRRADWAALPGCWAAG